MNTRDAYLILNLLPGIGPLRVAQMLSVFGDPQGVLKAPRSELVRIPGIAAKLADTVANWSSHCDPEAELERVERAGVTLITRENDDYPPLLREIHDPPLCLYVRGDPSVLQHPHGGISIVGSRRTTSYGVKMAEHLATAAAMAGWTVVSGLARGIDTVAHQACVRVGGKTVAVLGSGLARLYPQDNVELARRIADGHGTVISEFPMLFPPDKRSFPMRNRIISGMTRGTVVVEAGSRSGSLITAGQALEQNRQVFAVPGRADSPQSRGCHRLIKEGAKLVETFEDVLEEFTCLPGMVVPQAAAEPPADTTAARDSALANLQLSDLERTIVASLDDGATPVDELLSTIDEQPARVLGALVTLELRRVVRQLPGRRVTLFSTTLGQ